MTVGMAGFKATIIQIGLDQLFDSPREDQLLYIYWYLWTCFSARLLVTIVLSVAEVMEANLKIYGIGLVLLVTVAIAAVLFCIAKQNKLWFLRIHPSGINPYRLVYQVTKFASQHKDPLNRSAFTYCEDEVPSGIDLGKTKYGGPFTTEQVGGVKVIYGILKLLLAIGPAFSLIFIINPMISIYAFHIPSQTLIEQQQREFLQHDTNNCEKSLIRLAS